MTGKDVQQTPTRNKHADLARASSRRGRGGGRIAEKPISFGPSLKRLLGQLKPQRLTLTIVVVMAAVSVAFNVIGPKILGLSLIHISEPTRLGMISYAVFCLKKKN